MIPPLFVPHTKLVKLTIFLCALVFAVVKPFWGAAQISDTRFRRSSVDQGLSNSTINCIFQDSRGFMWFGTRDGLNRYDGSHVVIYRNDQKNKASISDNFINCIFEDAGHKLWVGTNYGLNRFDPVTNKFTLVSLHNGPVAGAENVTAIESYDKDNMWVGTYGGGLDLLNLKNGITWHFRHKIGDFNTVNSDTIQALHTVGNTLW